LSSDGWRSIRRPGAPPGIRPDGEEKRMRDAQFKSNIILLAVSLPAALFCDVRLTAPSRSGNVDHAHQEAEANYERGVALAEGDGVVQDYVLAARFYRLAAEAGHAPAQYDLACLYEKGLGVEQDLKLASEWYRKSAEQGHVEAQNNLGALYATGQGVPRNDAEAIRWYRKAAEQNDPEAQSNLGMMYLHGRGVEQDTGRAFELFLQAANQGYAVAQNNLALMYANGQAAARDYTSAYAWLDLAAEQLASCAVLRDRIGREMTPDEISRARDFSARKRVELELNGRDSK